MNLRRLGKQIAREVATRGFPNVEVVTNARPVGWDDIAKERPGERTNMVVIVCGQGDERLFSPSQGKPDMLVTFVVLKEIGEVSVVDDPRVAQMRGLSDLFVTTSVSDYVGDLIDNLASYSMAAVSNLAREQLERGELSLGVGIRVLRSVEVAKR